MGGMISECGISGGCSDLLISDFVNSPLVVSDDVAVLDCLPFAVSRAAKFGFISSPSILRAICESPLVAWRQLPECSG